MARWRERERKKVGCNNQKKTKKNEKSWVKM